MEQIDSNRARFFSGIRQRKQNLRPAASTAIVLQVTWVDQADHPDSCQRIRHVGGHSGKLKWRHTQAQAIEAIAQGVFAYYVKKDDRVLKLEVGLAPNGCKYLKTQADAGPPQFLLSLPKDPKRSRS
jgi:hypothetical protein